MHFALELLNRKVTEFISNKVFLNFFRNDRPSIFLSGAGEEKLYILSPKPKNKGWGYVKAAVCGVVVNFKN